MNAAVILTLLLLAIVLGVSGVAKLRDRQAVSDMFVSLRIPLVPPSFGAAVLPYAEIVLAVALVLAPGVLLVVAAAMALVVFAAYLVVIARATSFDPRPTCACFGALGGHRVDATTVLRNALLTGLAAFGLGGVVAADGDAWLPEAAADLGGAGAATVVVALTAAVVAWLVGRGGAAAAALPSGAATDEELDDYQRQPIPYGVVEDADGTSTTLRALARERARLLVLLTLGCGPCARVAEQLDGWADELDGLLAVHPVYAMAEVEGLPPLPHRRETTLHEPDGNVSRVFNWLPTPSAVVLGVDGLLAGGPAVGEHAIEEMVAELREAAAELAASQAEDPAEDQAEDQQQDEAAVLEPGQEPAQEPAR
jgi:hypothetical protein